MTDSFERPPGDDLARQRRKREARLLDQVVVDAPSLTLGDVVAEVLAASDGDDQLFDVHGYLAVQGHSSRTIEAVVGYLHRHHMHDTAPSQQLPVL